MKNNVYSVTQVNNYIKLLFKDDFLLNNIYIKGEVSNLKKHLSGHLYFSIKDENAVINAIIFNSNLSDISFELKNGDKIIALGYISLYEKTGQYQFYVSNLELEGKGNLQIEFEKLKEKLKLQGLFDSEYKKPIPMFPECIAVITSLTGAAIQDILNVLKRRNPTVKVVILPVLVQGENAANEIAKAIESINKWNKADVIIVGRGGGSYEDLAAFNEEVVAYAIFNSKIPIISAVGHETDFSIADFVADKRAATPSVAAEIAVFDILDFIQILMSKISLLNKSLNQKIFNCKAKFKITLNNSFFNDFLNKIYNYKNLVYNHKNYLDKVINTKIKQDKLKLENMACSLEKVSPINILKKGYSLVLDENNNVINSKLDVSKNQIVNINFYDGKKSAKIIE